MARTTVAATTLGCKVNFYETQAMLELFADAGFEITDFSEQADVYIINTCTVTNLGNKKSRQLIRKAAATNPNAIIAAVGCYVQAAQEELAKIPEINLLIGTKDRSKIVGIVESYRRESGLVSYVSKLEAKEEFETLTVKKLNDRQRAFIKIQDGCDRFCSYCIIPYVRGPIRSRKPEDVLAEIRTVAENGYKEIVLTGIHVSSYGKDKDCVSLLELLKSAHEIDGIMRIRLSSLEPTIMTREFVSEIAKLPKLCNHFHLSLQSGCTNTLRRMNRRYSAEEYENSVGMIREFFPDAAITTDVIVGFPGESDEDFEQSYEFCKRIKLSKIHVFPYSPKKGTKAFDMKDQIPPPIKEARAKRLLALSGGLSMEFASRFYELPVLFEKLVGKNNYMGYTTNYIPATKEIDIDIRGEILPGIVKPSNY